MHTQLHLVCRNLKRSRHTPHLKTKITHSSSLPQSSWDLTLILNEEKKKSEGRDSTPPFPFGVPGVPPESYNGSGKHNDKLRLNFLERRKGIRVDDLSKKILPGSVQSRDEHGGVAHGDGLGVDDLGHQEAMEVGACHEHAVLRQQREARGRG